MTQIRYQALNFTDASLERIMLCKQILNEYILEGLDCTLRQLYYRLVARSVIPNNLREYKKLQDLLNNARMAGYIDWDVIVDRTRYLNELQHWTSPSEMMRWYSERYHLMKWLDQPTWLECWVEKDALIGILERICIEYDVPYMACRGYASASEVWRAGHDRLMPILKAGKDVVILYLGDHDPSGIDMTRDVNQRLALFTEGEGNLLVKRLALNMDQIKKYDPPPNPTKTTDTRSPEYNEEFGEECWELDALDPKVILEIIRKAILQHRDEPIWDKSVREEGKHRATIKLVAENWEKSVKAVRKKPQKRKKKGK